VDVLIQLAGDLAKDICVHFICVKYAFQVEALVIATADHGKVENENSISSFAIST